MKLKRLKDWRERRGLSQQELSEKSGVARDGISRYENGSRDAHPGTAKRLADALNVEVKDLMEVTEKVEVEVGALDHNGVYRAEKLRFTGESVDTYEQGDATIELYECPGGYRVHVDNDGESGSYLHPSRVNRVTGELEYPLYTADEVAEEWPEFGSTVGQLRVRDID